MAISKIGSKALVDCSVAAVDIADGSITNAKLANTSITVNGNAVSLGGSVDLKAIDWQSVVTTNTTMVAGRGYFVNTTSGAITMTLPTSASAGDTIAIKDYAATFNTNNLTIGRNGHNIQGIANDSLISTARASLVLVYIDSTKGWLYTVESNVTNFGPQFISATGGTVTTTGDYKIHTFTGDGCFVVSSVGNPAGSDSVDYLVVAGGGAGANKTSPQGSGEAGGGGGAGGYRESSGAASGCYTRSPLGACVPALPVSATTYPVTVGAGGSSSGFCGSTSPTRSGSNSVFSTITSAGGGGGGARSFTTPVDLALGANGGSGGGGAYHGPNGVGQPGGTGNVPPVSPPQGQNGGARGCDVSPGGGHGGAGGGATVAGGAGGVANPGGPGGGRGGLGGAGATSSINGTPTGRAGGGGGGGNSADYPNGSGGGASDGGGGGSTRPDSGVSGTANTGGGGGGGSGGGISPGPGATGQGGKGIVIIRYKYQ